MLDVLSLEKFHISNFSKNNNKLLLKTLKRGLLSIKNRGIRILTNIYTLYSSVKVMLTSEALGSNFPIIGHNVGYHALVIRSYNWSKKTRFIQLFLRSNLKSSEFEITLYVLLFSNALFYNMCICQ